jgi:hypothetical protein
MQRATALALLLAVGGAAAAAAADAGALPPLYTRGLRALGPGDDEPPKFPDAYEMEWEFSMPYFMLLQPQGFK